ncbi:MarC family protein [Candidatus Bathyarchaeota archaeon]|nr:MarC family protein [Candidatus Bathyarchaeota archaeon]
MISMETFLQDLVRATLALFIVVDPLGNVPIMISLTRHLPDDMRRKAFNTASIVASAIAIIIVLGGQQILNLFRIDMYSFMIAGGVLLILISIKILIYGQWIEASTAREEVGAVPIAFPLLVGPGAITTLMVFHQTSGIVVTVVSVLLVMSLTRIVLRFIDNIYRKLGRIGSDVVARLMAIFIAAIAVQFIIDGLRHSFP